MDQYYFWNCSENKSVPNQKLSDLKNFFNELLETIYRVYIILCRIANHISISEIEYLKYKNSKF